MDLTHVGQIVAVQGRHHQLAQQTGASMEERQQARHGKSTAWPLFSRLAELVLQHGCIGHGTACAIEEERAMTMPAAFLGECGVSRVSQACQEVVENPQGQCDTGLTEG